jgi:hypothetical protein
VDYGGTKPTRQGTTAQRQEWHDKGREQARERSNHLQLLNWGMNILPSLVELADHSIIDNYTALVAQVTA